MKRSIASLPLLSVLCGLLWRVEIEVRWGWAGLKWITGFHYASIFICLSFVTWLYHFVPCAPPNRAWIRSAIGWVGGMLCYIVYELSFSLLCNRFPLPFPIYVIPYFLVFVAIPLSICCFASFFSPKFQKRSWLVVPLLFAASFPLSSFFLWITDHRGGTDPVHAVKSGFIFLGLVFAAGLPFLAIKSPEPVDLKPGS